MPSVWMMDGLGLIQFDSTTTAIINQTVPGVSPGAGGMALSPDGRRLYLVDDYINSIVQYRDSSTLGLVNSTTLGVASGVRTSYVSVDGTKLYVVDRGTGIIYLLDAFTLATITSTFIGNLPSNVVQTPDATSLSTLLILETFFVKAETLLVNSRKFFLGFVFSVSGTSK